MKNKIHIASLAVMLSAASTALAAVTNVAPSGTFVQNSGSFNAFTTVAHVIDGLTNESPTGVPCYWLAPAAKTNGYFILDLLGEYPVSSVVLYNTHGGAAEDSGTANFAVTASDTLGLIPATVDAFEVDTNLVPIALPVFSNSVPKVLTNFTKSAYLAGEGQSIEIADPPRLRAANRFLRRHVGRVPDQHTADADPHQPDPPHGLRRQ